MANDTVRVSPKTITILKAIKKKTGIAYSNYVDAAVKEKRDREREQAKIPPQYQPSKTII